jgi:branched-chain amino acid transport system substrate-binding protein
MKKTVFSILLVLSLVALPVFAVPSLAAEKTLVIGGIAFLTGPAAAGGMAAKAGWEIAVDKYNKAGGLKIGKDMYKIKLIVEDDAMSADQAATAATKLVKSDGATIIIGPLIDNLKNVVYPIASKAGALMAVVDGMNVSRALPYDANADVAADKPLYIRCHWANNEIDPHVFDYLQAHYPKVKKIAMCGVVEKAQEVSFAWLKGYLPQRGLQVVGALEQIAPDTSDYAPIVTRILAAKPDAIFIPISTPVMWGFVTKAARELGFKGPVFCTTHIDIGFQIMVAGKGNATDMFGTGTTLADEAGLTKPYKDAKADFLKIFPPKDLVSDAFLVGYNGLWVLLQTIEKAQSVDPQKILETYEKLTKKGDLQTLWGPAYVGGKKTLGVNRTLCYPYMLDTCINGVPKNANTVFISVP